MTQLMSPTCTKKLFFEKDYFFNYGKQVFDESIPDSQDHFFKEYTFLIIRPDALVTNSTGKVLKFMSERSFFPVYFHDFKFNKWNINAFWRFEVNRWPTERISSIESLLTKSRSMIVFFKRDKIDHRYACEYLKSIKGPAEIEKRKPGELRYEIAAKNGVLDYVHLPDEPIDIIREVGILFNRKEIKLLLSHCLNIADNKQQTIQRIEDLASRILQEDYIPSEIFEIENRMLDFTRSKQEFSSELKQINAQLSGEVSTLQLEDGTKKWSILKKEIEDLKEEVFVLTSWNRIILDSYLSEGNKNDPPLYEFKLINQKSNNIKKKWLLFTLGIFSFLGLNYSYSRSKNSKDV